MVDKRLPTPENAALEAEADARIGKLRVVGEALQDIKNTDFNQILGNSTILVSQFSSGETAGGLLGYDEDSEKELNLLVARKLLGANSGLLDMTPAELDSKSNMLNKSGVDIQYQAESQWLRVIAPTVIPGLKYQIETLSFNYEHPEFNYMSIDHKITN